MNAKVVDASIPAWACDILGSPGSGDPLRLSADVLVNASGNQVGTIADGIIQFPIRTEDPSIRYYDSIDGCHFHERSAVAYTMSSLDTPVYHDYLKSFAPEDRNTLIVDVGGGDGRNTEPWLRWGFKRVVLIDPIRSSLLRFRQRAAAYAADWFERVLTIQADARQLPLISGCAGRVLAIESIYYLNEDSPQGIAECRRSLAPDGQFMISQRDYEGGLLTRALYYGGAAGMLDLGYGRDMQDGTAAGSQVRSRCYTRAELEAFLIEQGFQILSIRGISAFSTVLSFLRGLDRLGDGADALLPEIEGLLKYLGAHGSFLRTHVAIVAHAGMESPGRNGGLEASGGKQT